MDLPGRYYFENIAILLDCASDEFESLEAERHRQTADSTAQKNDREDTDKVVFG